MQVKKEDIKEKILNAARRAFLEHGYAAASLRGIAEKAGLTKGAVYSYFDSKDALFCELTAPARSFVESEFKYDNSCYAHITKDGRVESYEKAVQAFRSFANTVLKHDESFKLLLFCAAGSSLQDYKESIRQIYARSFQKNLPVMTGKTCCDGSVSEMFVHTLANTYISFLEELVLHEPDREEVDEYVTQMAVFVHAGIEKLYRYQV